MGSMLCLRTFEDILDATQLAMSINADTVKLALFDDTLVIDVETFTAYGVAPFNAGEASGGGYSAGGAALSGKNWAIQSGTQRVRWTTSQLTISNVTDDFRYLLHYDDTLAGNNAFYVCDLGGAVSAVAEDVTFVPAANGWFRIRGLRTGT